MQLKAKIITLITLIIFAFSFQASAVTFLVEPGFGFADGNFEDDDGDPSDDWKHSGPGHGIRLGAVAGSLMAGFQYNGASTEAENVQSPNFKVEYTLKNVGLFAGYHGSFFRFWVAYYLNTELEYGLAKGSPALQVDNWNNNTKGAKLEGDGYAVGLGIRPYWDWLNLFIELHIFTYDTLTDKDGVESAAGDDATTGYWLFGVSFPLEF